MQYDLANQEEVPRGRGLRTSQITPRMQAFRKYLHFNVFITDFPSIRRGLGAQECFA